MTARDLDLVLVGATGFVGRLTARHLAEHAPGGVRIGLAGRSAERLVSLRRSLPTAAQEWPLTTVDVTDPAAVAELAARTRVVVSTAGPYLRYGLPLVQACANAGTDYADLTGETIFVRRSIDTGHAPAMASGARIVHSCGFDSIPSDLGVGLNALRATAEGQGLLGPTVLHVVDTRGGLSGGTIDSLRQQIIEASADLRLRALVASPEALLPEWPTVRPRRGRRRSPVDRDPVSGVWQAPFPMGVYNGQIVRRTDALSGTAGPDFAYREVVDTRTGLLGAVTAAAVALGPSAVVAGMGNGLTRAILDRLLPVPGAGPSEAARRRGRFTVQVVSITTAGAVYRTRVGAERDPGYDGTAIMLGQSALALAMDRGRPGRAGVLTPMAALGEALVPRLRACGFSIETERLS